MARGQFVLEFLMSLALAVFVIMIYLAVSMNMFTDVSERQRLIALNDLGYMIQDELLLAETVHDGYARNITLPARADRFTYSISNDNTSVTLESGDVTITYDLPPISGTFQKGRITIHKDGGIRVVPG